MMVRSVLCLAVFTVLALNIASADEKPKAQAVTVKAHAVKPPAVKPQAVPAAKAAESPQAKRVVEAKAQLTAARAKLDEAQKEAQKAREQFSTAEGKVNAVKQNIASMEKALVDMKARDEARAREATANEVARAKARAEAKQWAEMTKRISTLEREVQFLKEKREAAPRKPAAAAAFPKDGKPAPKKEPKPAAK